MPDGILIKNSSRVTTRAACVAAVTFVTGGCVSTLGGSHASNKPAAPQGATINGVPYRLPRVTMAVALVRGTGGVRVELTSPIYGPDKGPAYLLQYHPRSTAKDTFNISVDPATSLLSSVKGEADDQGAKIIEELGKLAGALVKPEAAIEGPDKQVLYEAIFDPGIVSEVDAVTAGLNAALNQPLRDALRRDCDYVVDSGVRTASVKTQKERDKKAAELRASTAVCVASAKFVPTKIWLKVDYKAFQYATGVAAADCNVGICTRVLSPARLSVGTGDPGALEPSVHAIGARGFAMPNGSDAVPIELKRAAFAKVTYDIKLKDGLISTSDVIKESEALAIVAAPVKGIDAFFKSLANIVQLKIDLTTKQKELLAAEKDKLAAEEALEAARKDAVEDEKAEAGAKAESAADVAGSAPFLSVEIPGFGAGSGMELEPKGIPITKEEPAGDVQKPSDVLGGPVQGGGDGPVS